MSPWLGLLIMGAVLMGGAVVGAFLSTQPAPMERPAPVAPRERVAALPEGSERDALAITIRLLRLWHARDGRGEAAQFAIAKGFLRRVRSK